MACEQDWRVVAEPEVLRPLAHVERNRCVALAGVAAVKLDDAILKPQPAERRRERLFIEHHHVEPAVQDLIFWRAGQFLGIWTFGFQRGGDAGVVLYLHPE